MAKINWNEYKEYKQYNSKENNFEILLDFIKSYYNMTNAYDIFAILNEDDTAKMMLEKRDIKDAESLENFMLKL